MRADACLDLKHFDKAASASGNVQPLHDDARYLPQLQVRQLLDGHDKTNAGLLGQPACSSFKAAKPLGLQAADFDVTGVVAAVCRHEFVITMTDVHTADCFVYYELIMRRAEQLFGLEAAGSMDFFFLNVACKFEKYYERCDFSFLATMFVSPSAAAFLAALSFLLGVFLAATFFFGAACDTLRSQKATRHMLP